MKLTKERAIAMFKYLASWFAVIRALVYQLLEGPDTLMRYPPKKGAHRMRLVAHRGASITAPENTMAALHAAADAGVQHVECDVHLTLCEQVVVVHDKTLKRTGRVATSVAGDDILDTPIDELRLEQMGKVDIGSYLHERFADERVPTLRAFVREAKTRETTLYIEIKSGEVASARDHRLVELAVQVVQGEGLPAATVIWIGFSVELMKKVKVLLPDCKVLLLGLLLPPTLYAGVCGCLLPSVFRKGCLFVDKAVEAGLDGIDVPADSSVVTKGLVEYATGQGISVNTWVYPGQPESPRLFSALAEAGVHAHTSNLPSAMLQWSEAAKALSMADANANTNTSSAASHN